MHPPPPFGHLLSELIVDGHTSIDITALSSTRSASVQPRADVAWRLLTLAVHTRFLDVHTAVALAKSATTTADAAESRDAADVRFESLKFSSAVLREAGRYAEAEGALSKGEEAARHASDPDFGGSGHAPVSRAFLRGAGRLETGRGNGSAGPGGASIRPARSHPDAGAPHRARFSPVPLRGVDCGA
jgi:hypothetical protein